MQNVVDLDTASHRCFAVGSAGEGGGGGFGSTPAEGSTAVAPVMEHIYRLPFDRFTRYVPCGTPADVADALGPYVDAGCRSFNLLAHAADPTSVAPAAAEVRHILEASA